MPQPQPAGIYAAVYITSESTGVGGLSKIGLFRRIEGDSAWVNLRPNTITPGMGFSNNGVRQQLYLAGGNGLHRSTDWGATWKVLTGWQTKEVLSVAIHPVNPGILYISTPFGVFKSEDGGAQWREAMKGFRTWYVRQVKIDADQHDWLYATGEDALYATRDGGESWTAMSVGVPGIKTLFQHPVDRNILLVGTEDHGVRYSVDRGKTWLVPEGLASSAVYAIASTRDGSQIYAGGFRTGLWRSGDRGRSWTHVWPADEIEAIYAIFVHPKNSAHMLVGTNGKGVFDSVDGGYTWRQAGLPFAHVKEIQRYP